MGDDYDDWIEGLAWGMVLSRDDSKPDTRLFLVAEFIRLMDRPNDPEPTVAG